MTRVLLVDTNFSAGPLRHALAAGGHEVWVAGGKPDDALAIGEKNYVELDYSDADGLAALARELEVQAIVPGCNDVSYAACCRAAFTIGLAGFESEAALCQLHNKDEFRKLCQSLLISAPKTYESIGEALQAPRGVIVKPIDAYSGRGIHVLSQPNSEDLQAAVNHAAAASRTNKALIEDFVDGQLYSYSAFLSDGEVIVAFNVAEFGSVNPYVVDISYVVPELELAAALKKDIEAIANELSIISGLMHLQYITDGRDYWFIELTRRCPGDLYSELIRLSTGFSYADAYIASFTGGELPREALRQDSEIIRHTVASDRTGIFESLTFSGANDLLAWYPLARTGEILAPSPGGRIGVAFFGVPDASERQLVVEQLLSAERYQIQFRESQHAR